MSALEWQVASGSRTAHVLDAAQNGWRTPDGRRKLSGPRAMCGRYPQRNADGVWFSFPVNEDGANSALRHYQITRCQECADALGQESPGGAA